MVLFTNAWLSLGINDATSPPLPLKMKLKSEGKGLRTFSWRLSERFLVCSVLRSVRGRWSYTSQRR